MMQVSGFAQSMFLSSVETERGRTELSPADKCRAYDCIMYLHV